MELLILIVPGLVAAGILFMADRLGEGFTLFALAAFFYLAMC